MLARVTIFFSILVLSIFLNVNGAQAARAVRRVAAPTPSPVPEIQTIAVDYEEVNPTDGTQYWIKRAKEKVGMFFSFSNNSKIEFQKKLTTTRLAELAYIINNKEMGYFEKATQRYFTTAGQLTDFIVEKKATHTLDSIKEVFSSHIPVLTKLRDVYNPTTAEWRFVEDDINYIKGDILRLPPQQ